ncbi:MAG: DUF4338 domain-containing protein, partial [Candidatus Thorarchaeota archaeon]|nr:DUF4338 domain-containing protein [Candidatus Thorarchaeota archaeon]
MASEKSGMSVEKKNLDIIQTGLYEDTESILGTILDRLEGIREISTTRANISGDIASLKKKIVSELKQHLLRLGYVISENGLIQDRTLTKMDLRAIQSGKRIEILYKNLRFLKRNARKLLNFVADGTDIRPEEIDPEIIELRTGDRKHDLFRFLTLYWSVPVSQGYGRRMRFLVRDRQNGKIIGLFALGDPVFNLRVRDKWVGWTTEQRRQNLRSVLDAFVLGAIPPYSYLLGGKLVCALTTSKEVREAYRNKYSNTTSVIFKRRHDNDLLLITT